MAETEWAQLIRYWRFVWKSRQPARLFAPYRAIPSLLTAIVAFAIRHSKNRAASISDMWIGIGITLGVYLILYAIDSLWGFGIITPAVLFTKQSLTIHELSEKLEIPDKALAEHLRESLEHVGSNGKKVIRFLLWHGETMLPQIKITGMSPKEIQESLESCLSENLIKSRIETRGTYTSPLIAQLVGTYIFHFVPDELKDALTRLLSHE